MARRMNVSVSGTSATMRNLRELRPSTQRKVLRPAISKGATPLLKAARRLAPVGDGLTPDGQKRKHLAKTLKKTRAKTYKNGSVIVVIGPEKGAAPHAHLVDKGTKAHTIVLSKPANLGNVILPAGTRINHPGAKASHFMDRASQASSSQVLSIVEKTTAKGIEKEAARLAKRKG
jgi:HK97 gp10 family phage protein